MFGEQRLNRLQAGSEPMLDPGESLLVADLQHVREGMYDLMPVRLSARSNYVEFDDTTVAALSPIRHLDRLHAPLIIAYGTCETPEFQRQNREFAAAVRAAGKSVQLLVGENYNHFELSETLGNPYGLLGPAALDLMARR